MAVARDTVVGNEGGNSPELRIPGEHRQPSSCVAGTHSGAWYRPDGCSVNACGWEGRRGGNTGASISRPRGYAGRSSLVSLLPMSWLGCTIAGGVVSSRF